MLRFHLCGWVLCLAILSGCHSPEPVRRITAENYLTAIPDPKTLGETYVSDPDGVLPPGAAPALNAQLDSLDRSGRAHIDVVLVRSLGTAVPKTAATALFNKWKIGSKTTNNGLLMLLVPDQRRVEFETGYGLEADLPDIICYRIQQRYMLEPARAGDYGEAVRQGVAAIIRHLRPPAALPKRVRRTAADSTQFYLDSLQRAIMAQNGMLDDEDPLNTAQPGEDLGAYYAPPEPGPPVGTLALAALALGLYLVLWHRTTQGLRARWWLLLVPFGLVVGLVIPALADALGTGTFLALLYGLPLLYLHGYFGRQYYRARRLVAPLGRPEAYGQLQAAHRGLGFTAYLFPVGLAHSHTS
ncbi:MAG: TPM domain-containing protein [Cytophagaceae bacterium]|nr:MAG: TPM domain-containing protein [Cytophagaceae bacterium]